VVLDTPAVLATTDAQVIVREADAVLLVVSASTSRTEIEDTLRALERVGGKVVGTVLNRADIRVRRYEAEPSDPELPTPGRNSSRRSETAAAKASSKAAATTATATTTTKAPPRKRASTRTNRST
jgi:hypothetical protein